MAERQTLPSMTARQLRDHLVAGRDDIEAFYDGHLRYAQALDERIHAFASLDERVVRLQAAHRKTERTRGEPLPALYGVPVAVKDIIDTIDFPTAFGSPLHADRYAVADATVVQRLRAAGAVIFGKSVTTEFAGMHPGPTRNPHQPEHTPGGSSSGSAAAVAAGIVPVALGTQTNGSVLRPASFCGVYGFKPTRGLLPRTGVFEQSPSLDQLGVFARNIDDLALVTELLSGDDGSDPLSLGQAPRPLAAVAASEPPVDPRFCFVRTPWWDRMEAEAREACEFFLDVMKAEVTLTELPSVVEQSVSWHRQVHEAELAFAMQREYLNHPAQLSAGLRAQIERGLQASAVDYLTARDRMPHVACAFDSYFEHYDAILTPAALGPAPKGLASTGDPIMQTVWSFAGLPSLAMPLLTLSDSLPFGIQAEGAQHQDGRLLRSCRWLVQRFIERTA